MKAILYMCLLLCILFGIAQSASVLMYFPISSPSHKNVFRPLAQALAERGHQVTLVTCFKDTEVHANITEIHVQSGQNIIEDVVQVVANQNTNNALRAYVYGAHQEALEHPNMERLLSDPNVKFDLTFVFPLFNEVGYFLAQRFHSPLVLYMPAVANSILTTSMGYFDNPSFVTTSTYEFAQTETPCILRRALGLLLHVAYEPLKRWGFLSTQEDILRNMNLSMNVDLLRLEQEAQFGMYFSHFAFDSIRPTLPNTIDIGLIHCRESRSLPTNLKQWLKGEDFIYISFGSWFSFNHISQDLQSIIWTVINKLPIKVVMKVGVTTHNSTNNSKNVYTDTWFAQQDILGSSRCRLFVSQGGMMSLQESLFHGVPLLIIPFFGDQFSNAQRALRQGYGRKLNSQDLSESTLRSNITEMLQTSFYQDKALAMKQLLRDDVNSPLDRAVFWSEYLIRHQGASHLKFPGKDVGYVRFFHLDIFALFGILSSIMLLLTWRVSTWCVRKFI